MFVNRWDNKNRTMGTTPASRSVDSSVNAGQLTNLKDYSVVIGWGQISKMFSKISLGYKYVVGKKL